MKILTVGPAHTPHLVRPVRSLLQRGHTVSLVGYNGSDPFDGEPLPGYSWRPDPVSGHYPVSPENARESVCFLKSIIETFKPDVIHLHWISWHLPVIKRLAPETPLVVSVWGSDLNIALAADNNGRYTWRGEEYWYARELPLADFLIVDDPTMPGKCAFAAPQTPVKVLPLGADDIFFEGAGSEERIRERLSIPHKFIFTACRMVTPVYRPEAILQAFAQGAKGKDAVLLFKKFISERIYADQLKRLARELGIDRQVRFYNTFSPRDLRDLYAASTALINFPSRDAFPVTFSEAAACGARVISCWHPSYDVPLVREFFQILEDDSVSTLAGAIRNAMEEPASKARLAAAQAFARDMHSHERYINGLLEIYSSLSPAGSNSGV